MDVCLLLINAQRAKVTGIKVSLLDAAHEVTMRRQLPPGVRRFTGDDFNYVDLITGDEQRYSDAMASKTPSCLLRQGSPRSIQATPQRTGWRSNPRCHLHARCFVRQPTTTKRGSSF